MGTVYARGVYLWIGYRLADGRWRYQSSTFRIGEETKARELLASIEEKITAGIRGAELGPLSVAEWGEKWSIEREGRLWNSAKEWRSVELHALPMLVDERRRFGRLLLTEVRPRHLLQLVRGLRAKQLAPRTVSNIYGAVHKLFADAVILELLGGNPCVLPSTEHPRRRDANPAWRDSAIYTREEALQLMSRDDIGADRRLLYALAFLAGLREGEAAALRWRDYDSDAEPLGLLAVHKSFTRGNKEVKGTKTDQPRKVPVHPALAAMLAKWKLSGWRSAQKRRATSEDLIVPNSEGRLLTDLVVNDWLHKDLARLGFRVRRYHDMRRTFISLALTDGARGDVLRWVTHGSRRDVLDQYTSLPWSALCEAVKCLRLRPVGAATLRRLAR